jgi:hypothetical protein
LGNPDKSTVLINDLSSALLRQSGIQADSSRKCLMRAAVLFAKNAYAVTCATVLTSTIIWFAVTLWLNEYWNLPASGVGVGLVLVIALGWTGVVISEPHFTTAEAAQHLGQHDANPQLAPEWI